MKVLLENQCNFASCINTMNLRGNDSQHSESPNRRKGELCRDHQPNQWQIEINHLKLHISSHPRESRYLGSSICIYYPRCLLAPIYASWPMWSSNFGNCSQSAMRFALLCPPQ